MYLPADRTQFPEYKQHAAPGKGAAKSLLASVYLTMAGYPLNKGTEYYQLAAQKSKEVIDNHVVYGYELMADFAGLWRLKNDPPVGINPEVVFGVFYKKSVVNWNVDGFAYGNMSAPQPSLPNDVGGWADYCAEINFFNDFPAGPRKDATFISKIVKKDSTVIEWQNNSLGHPYFKKYVDGGSFDENAMDKGQDWWSNRAMIVIRYAEVLLCYAEAKAMADGPDATAYEAINQVRFRAGLPDLTEGLSQTAFRDSVLAERAWEFAGMEPAGHWFDLVRTETVEEAAANRHPGETPIAAGNLTKEDYFCPIPISEKLINPNL
jgi:starch-binding outer membrane protein, SusD/RagB family